VEEGPEPDGGLPAGGSEAHPTSANSNAAGSNEAFFTLGGFSTLRGAGFFSKTKAGRLAAGRRLQNGGASAKL
jgi:hypothetical protein